MPGIIINLYFLIKKWQTTPEKYSKAPFRAQLGNDSFSVPDFKGMHSINAIS